MKRARVHSFALFDAWIFKFDTLVVGQPECSSKNQCRVGREISSESF
jgi:hypothetical protein